MKLLLPLLLATALFIPAMPQQASANDRETITYRIITKDDRGRTVVRTVKGKAPRPARHLVRAKMAANIYKYEGNATVRHDVVSSPEIMFHIDSDGNIRTGHAWDK
ncbi:MAG: hypothetical protein AAF236_07790 [Verrucomicrobiota bacterium]